MYIYSLGGFQNLQSIFKFKVMFEEMAPQRSLQNYNSPIPSLEEISQKESQAGFINDGHWTQAEILRFIAFLTYNRQTLKLKLQRRTSKVFKQMSQFVGSRTSVQCRSQNQRLFRKFKNFRNIVSAFKALYGRDQFQQEYQELSKLPAIKFKTELQMLVQSRSKETAEYGVQTEEQLCPQRNKLPLLVENQVLWPPSPWNSYPNLMIFPYY